MSSMRGSRRMHRAMPLAVLAALLCAGLAPALPLPAGLPEASELTSFAADPAGNSLDLHSVLRQPALEPVQRAVPRSAGTVLHTQFLYGPYQLQPGNDMTRLALDVPLGTGFLTRFSYHLIDVATGEEPTNLQVHIHHGLWFNMPGYMSLVTQTKFVFGTGEERTHYDFDERAAAQPGGPHYGLFFDPLHLDLLVLMLHNKEEKARVMKVVLDAEFVYGDAASIKAAASCDNPPGLEGDGCLAGADFHNLEGHLWGAQFDVPRDPQGTGEYIFPPGQAYHFQQFVDAYIPLIQHTAPGVLVDTAWVAEYDATYIAAAGHVHPGGEATIVVNEGPEGSGCEADLDHDGLPGVTLFRSDKFDRNPASWPWSEDFQMGVTKPDWRAPVHQGDRLAEFGVYANRDHPGYQQMTFTSSYFDPLQPPPPRHEGCVLSDYAPYLLSGQGDPVQTIMNRPWDTPLLPMCGVEGEGASGPCETPLTPPPAFATDAVGIGDFQYVSAGTPLGAVPVIHHGQSITFTDLDVAQVVRHTVTSCPWPCDGTYTANYPLPDGTFDSNKLGNLDLIDFGTVPPTTQWSTPPDLQPGWYSYYCRIHPDMRGQFEVVP
jgi:plastocyanin